jgi:hypothetical protein
VVKRVAGPLVFGLVVSVGVRVMHII